GDMAAEPAGGGERQVRDPVPGGERHQLGCLGAHLPLGRGRQVRRLGQWLAHLASLSAITWPGRRGARWPGDWVSGVVTGVVETDRGVPGLMRRGETPGAAGLGSRETAEPGRAC